MGITKLADLIRIDAPSAISHKDISDYTGRIIALDTSIVVNQFRAATPSLSPLAGLFFRTLTLLEHDIKPVFVFDGKPPREKTAVLEKRADAAGWNSANLSGTASSMTLDCLELLKLLGVPVIQAPGDGEALCAKLVREGSVDAVASEDMDTLPFGANVLIRQLNAKRDSDIIEYSLPKLLDSLQITHKEFVDLCILLGCDYCDKISGLGPRRALMLIQQHRTIENVVLHINRKTHPVPPLWKYQEARKLFLELPKTVAPHLIWTEPDEESLVKFLCGVKHIKEARIRHRMETFRQLREKKREDRDKEKASGSHRQARMEDFFRVTRKRPQAVAAAHDVNNYAKRPKSKK
ncbi:probable flap endonuclease 1 homolog [Thalassophryne amazonica]|uniref:probable flap endonuclease 1 homolog n=1 Tax=Thalassophryne amazonica TaxID=390379 RepID=UPI001471200B|nr:probable flap endonuclease 1 homolog [Thalassophryne amazonica]